MQDRGDAEVRALPLLHRTEVMLALIAYNDKTRLVVTAGLIYTI